MALLSDIHKPLLEHILPALSLKDILGVGLVCRGLRESVRAIPSELWRAKLKSWLPATHPLLQQPASSLGLDPYAIIQRSLGTGAWTERYVWREQIIVHSFSPDGSVLVLLGDSGGCQGHVKIYQVKSGRLLQACTLGPIWTLPESGNPTLSEPVQWAADCRSGIMLVKGTGINHIVSFGPDHFATGQYQWRERWSLAPSGTLLASWQESAGMLEANLRLFDSGLQLILVMGGSMISGTTCYSRYGRRLRRRGRKYFQAQRVGPESERPAWDKVYRWPAWYQVYRDQESFERLSLPAACKGGQTQYILLSLAWNYAMGILALTHSHLVYQLTPSSAWKRKNLVRDLKYEDHDARPLRSAVWADNTFCVLLAHEAGVSLWDAEHEAFRADNALPDLHPSMELPSTDTLCKVSPDGRTLAVLGTRALMVLQMRSQRILHTETFLDSRLPASLAWSHSGDKLMLARGDLWRVLCFCPGKYMGRAQARILRQMSQISQSGDRMADVLKDVSCTAGAEPELVPGMPKAQASSSCTVKEEDPDAVQPLKNQDLMLQYVKWGQDPAIRRLVHFMS